jgi:DNA processing protein
MEKEVWIRLRRLQTHPSHLTWRPLILSLLEESPIGSDWSELLRRARERDCPLEFLESSAPEDADIARSEAGRLRRKGIELLTPVHPLYPPGLRRSVDPPLSLTMMGNPACLKGPALSVVGSREPQIETLHWMEDELSAFCQSTKAVIVSGGARGVDQKAHSVAIRNSSPTVVVLPSGIETPYPSDIERWFQPVLEGGGAIMSEYPGPTPMRKPHFHHRNRLIAAAGILTFVIEARARSGTLITAMRAAEIGRPLLVLPGHPRDLGFGGSLQLLAEGATMVRQNEDLTLFWQTELLDTKQAHLSVEVEIHSSP